jgi:hypothetical protein
MLDAGEAKFVRALARRCSVGQAYIDCMLKLATLAPDIVDAIIEGNEPSGLRIISFTVHLQYGPPGCCNVTLRVV